MGLPVHPHVGALAMIAGNWLVEATWTADMNDATGDKLVRHADITKPHHAFRLDPHARTTKCG